MTSSAGDRAAPREHRASWRELEERATHIGDDLLAAEYLAARTALEWLDGWAEDRRAMRLLAARQLRATVDDHLHALELAAAAGSLEELAAIPPIWGERRRRHLGEAREGLRTVLDRQRQRALEPLRSAWGPLLQLIGRDLGRGEG